MKKFLHLLVTLALLIATNSWARMSHQDILSKLQSYGQQRSEKPLDQEEKMSPDADKRFKMIINDAEFFGTKLRKIKDRKLKSSLNKSLRATSAGYFGNGADLRDKDAPVLSQWNGTCSAHGLSAAMENFVGGIDLSERHIWSKYHAYSCEAAVNAWENGDCVTTEAMWEHERTNPKEGYLDKENCFTVLLEATYIDDDLQKMIDSLDAGHPVYIGLSVTKSMMNCDTVLNPKSSKTGGGHALSVVGYKLDSKVMGGGYFIVKNSWGISCGDKGYQYIPFQHCLRSDLYCIMWTIDQVDSGGYVPPAPTPSPTPTPEKKCLQWKRIWYMPWKMRCVLYI